MSIVKRAIAPLVIAAVVVALAIVVFGGGDSQKTLTAYFPRAVSLYEGSDVRVLGVPVGTVDTITPEGTRVKVVMRYDGDVEIPSQAEAIIVSPAIVGDRYVQLTPAYKTGDVLEDDAILDEGRTAVPLELDQIYSSLDRLTVALGPNGANANGALSDLLEVTARNFGGQGEKFHQTIEDFSQLSKTLDDNKDELFDSTAELSKFITKLAENDGVVRRFNTSLGRVSTVLAGERQALAGALRNLSIGLGEVGSFVRENREVLGKDIAGLNRFLKVVVRQREAFDQVLRIAPVALNNLALTYNPDTGTLDTNANFGNIFTELENNPKDFLCALVSSQSNGRQLCDTIQGLPLPRSTPFKPGPGAFIGDTSDPTLGGLVAPVVDTTEDAR